MPKIAIIIPVYNAAKTLEKCLLSIEKQSFDDYELILVDDGSTDRSKQIYTDFATNDSRIQIIYQENAGPSAARNKGVEISHAPYIAFVDADDYLDENYLAHLYEQITASHADLVCCAYYEINQNIKKPIPVDDFNVSGVLAIENYIKKLFQGTAAVLWTKLYKSEIIRQNTIRFPEHVNLSEDLIFNLQYALQCNKVVCSNANLYYYSRMNDSSLSGTITTQSFDNVVETNKILIGLSKEVKYLSINKITTTRLWNLTKGFLNQIQKQDYNSFKSLLSEQINQPCFQKNINNFEEQQLLENISLYLIRKKYFRVLYLYLKILFMLKKIKKRMFATN